MKKCVAINNFYLFVIREQSNKPISPKLFAHFHFYTEPMCLECNIQNYVFTFWLYDNRNEGGKAEPSTWLAQFIESNRLIMDSEWR